ncbi:hypothetical protein K501DRAFT_274138 [Backusella circina FSU 941]|nr:hypothetical protein K501DRAFT_274138 [Backusella circina FSU 941]
MAFYSSIAYQFPLVLLSNDILNTARYSAAQGGKGKRKSPNKGDKAKLNDGTMNNLKELKIKQRYKEKTVRYKIFCMSEKKNPNQCPKRHKKVRSSETRRKTISNYTPYLVEKTENIKIELNPNNCVFSGNNHYGKSAIFFVLLPQKSSCTYELQNPHANVLRNFFTSNVFLKKTRAKEISSKCYEDWLVAKEREYIKGSDKGGKKLPIVIIGDRGTGVGNGQESKVDVNGSSECINPDCAAYKAGQTCQSRDEKNSVIIAISGISELLEDRSLKELDLQHNRYSTALPS